MPGLAPILVIPAMAAGKAAGVGLIGQVLIGAGASALAQAVSPSPTLPQIPVGIEIQQNKCALNCSLPLIYGQVKISGNDVFYFSHGENNKYLWIVEVYGEGECEGIAQNDDSDPKDLVFINDELLSGSIYENLVSYWFYSGTAAQTYDTNLNTECPDWTDNLKRTCYVVWKFTMDPAKFSSIPRRQIILKGRKLWLPDNTKAYSNNAAAVLYDFLRSPHCAVALGWPENDMLFTDEIDYYSYQSAYNYCQPDSATNGWEYNGIVNSGEKIDDIINRIRKHFRGAIVPSDGILRITYRDLNHESPVMNLTDNHIARDENGKAMIGITPQGLITNAEGLRVSFINPSDDRYFEDFFIVGESEEDIRNVDLPGYNSKEMAGAMGSYILERNRDPYERIITGIFRDDCQQLEKEDLITLTCTALGYSAQYMRIIGTQLLESGLVNLEMQLEHADLYNDTYDVEVETSYTCTLPDPASFDPVTQPDRYVELSDEDFDSNSEYQLTTSDLNKVYIIDSNNDLSVLLPSVDSDHLGSKIKFKHYGTGKLTVTAADSDTIDISSAGGDIYHQQSGISQEGSVTLQLATDTHWAIDSFLGPWFSDAAEELFLHTALYINDKTFGNKGVQIEYNAGSPRIHCGDGANAFIKHDGTKLTWKGTNTELDASGNLICTGGTIGGWTIGATTISSTNITIDSANEKIYSANYVTGPAGAGFFIGPDLIEAGNIAARGILRTAVFQKDVISAIGGNMLISKGSDVLAEDLEDDSEELVIEGNETFEVGDILRIKDGTDDEWFQVTSVSSDLTTYNVTRDKADAYGSSESSFAGLPEWKKGATVVNYGASADGLIHMTASETNAPYLSVLTHAGAPWSALTTRMRIGNLNGYLGYSSDIYGIGIGDTNNYIKYDPTNGLEIQVNAEDAIVIKSGGDIKLESDASNPGHIEFAGTTYSCRIGSWIATGASINFEPSGGGNVGNIELQLGTTTTKWKTVEIYAKDVSFLCTFTDANNYSVAEVYVDYIAFKVKASGNSYELRATYNAGTPTFAPIVNKSWDLGLSSYAWDDAYADDWHNVADFPFLDDRNDLSAICNIKGSGVFDKRTDLELIDDTTLPIWLLSKDKKTKKIVYDPEGKPYIALKTAISLSWGAIRQLKDEIDQLKEQA